MKPTRKLTDAQVELLDRVEDGVRSVAVMLDCPWCLNYQIAVSLERIGLYCALEVAMPGLRRVDIVVVSSLGTCAIEVDGAAPRSATLQKFRDMPPEVIRMLVLRKRRRMLEVAEADRLVMLDTSSKGLHYLTEGILPYDRTERKGPRSAHEMKTLLESRIGERKAAKRAS